jgi:hypothetical protein
MSKDQIRSVFCRDPYTDPKFTVFENFERLTKYADQSQAENEAKRRSKGLENPAENLKKMGQIALELAQAEEELYDIQKEAGLSYPNDPNFAELRAKRDQATRKVDDIKLKAMDLNDKITAFYKSKGQPIWFAADKKSKTYLSQVFKFECTGTIYTTNSEYGYKPTIDGDLEDPILEHKFGVKKPKYKRFACMNNSQLEKALVLESNTIKGEIANDAKNKKTVFYNVGSFNAPTAQSQEVFIYGSPHTDVKIEQPGYMYNEKNMSLAIKGKITKNSLRAPTEIEVNRAEGSKTTIVRTLIDNEPKEVKCKEDLEVKKLKIEKADGLLRIIPSVR